MYKLIITSTAMSFFLIACSAEVGSKEWCDNLKEKDKGEWTANNLTDYTKYCIF